MDDKWITPQQLADQLGLPLQTIYSWNHDGSGPVRHKFGRCVRYRTRDVEVWTRSKRVDA
jgi:excisionase family DNA binding protein